MWCKDVVLLALDYRQIKGMKGEYEYNFPSVVVGDEDFNKFSVNVGRDDLDEGTTLPKWFLEAIEDKGKFTCDIKIFPNKDDKYGQTAKMEIHNLRNEA